MLAPEQKCGRDAATRLPGRLMLEFELPAGLLDGDPPSWYAVVRPDELRAPTYDGTPRAASEGAEPRILILEAGRRERRVCLPLRREPRLHHRRVVSDSRGRAPRQRGNLRRGTWP